MGSGEQAALWAKAEPAERRRAAENNGSGRIVVVLVDISLFRKLPKRRTVTVYAPPYRGKSVEGEAGRSYWTTAEENILLPADPAAGREWLPSREWLPRKVIRAGRSTISLDSVGLKFAIVAALETIPQAKKTDCFRRTGKLQGAHVAARPVR